MISRILGKSQLGIEYLDNVPILELKMSNSLKSYRFPIVNKEVAAKIFREYIQKHKFFRKEVFMMLAIDEFNCTLGISQIGRGKSDRVSFDVRKIFTTSLLSNASGFIVGHNHPSGDLSPSEGDTQLTKEIYYGAQLLGLEMIDHLIVTQQSYYSFMDNDFLSWQICQLFYSPYLPLGNLSFSTCSR